jgi:hypothetical protein
MASLCKGPLEHFSEPSISFEMDRLSAWINQLLDSPQTRYRNIARIAIENILLYNMNSESFFDQILENCYSHLSSCNITAGYFLSLVDLLARNENWDHPIPKVVCLALYHMCSENATIRKGAARLLLIIDKKLNGEIEKGLSHDIIGWYQNSPNERLQEDDAITLNMDQTDLILPEGPVTVETTALCSALPSVYRLSRKKIAERLAKQFPHLIHDVNVR